MKITTLAAAIALVVFAIGNVSAITPTPGSVTYKFTANLGQPTDYNNSTITLEGTSTTTDINMTNWDLVGPGGPATPSNSEPTTESFSFYDSSTFYGFFSLAVPGTGFTFTGSNSAVDGGFLSSSGDPSGVWSAVPAGVPDTGNGIQLLAIALAGLVVCRRWIVRPA